MCHSFLEPEAQRLYSQFVRKQETKGEKVPCEFMGG